MYLRIIALALLAIIGTLGLDPNQGSLDTVVTATAGREETVVAVGVDETHETILDRQKRTLLFGGSCYDRQVFGRRCSRRHYIPGIFRNRNHRYHHHRPHHHHHGHGHSGRRGGGHGHRSGGGGHGHGGKRGGGHRSGGRRGGGRRG